MNRMIVVLAYVGVFRVFWFLSIFGILFFRVETGGVVLASRFVPASLIIAVYETISVVIVAIKTISLGRSLVSTGGGHLFLVTFAILFVEDIQTG